MYEDFHITDKHVQNCKNFMKEVENQPKIQEMIADRKGLRSQRQQGTLRITQKEFWYAALNGILTTHTKGRVIERLHNEDLFDWNKMRERERPNIPESDLPSDLTYRKRKIEWVNTLLGNMHDDNWWGTVFSCLNTLNIPPCDDTHKKERMRQEQSVANGIEQKGMPQKIDGVGIKQSRNILQILGLADYEMPIDSRVISKLYNDILQEDLNINLGCRCCYSWLLGKMHALADGAGISPWELDAYLFGAED